MLLILRARRTNAVELDTPDVARPGDDFAIRYRSAKPGKIAVFAVDEGILRLTKFQSPDPVKWYFGKRALSLNYRDDYGRLLDPNLGAPANVNFGADEVGGEA